MAISVFEAVVGALLILGAPGAGKTTSLLELARDLIARAEQDEGHPIPVVFNLSSWAEKRRPLKEWLVDELNTKYDVPRKLAQEWIATDAILPLLDGLDEVAVGHREACVEAINLYRQERGLVPIAVCSRAADYEVLATKLRLQGAIVVRPLAKAQVNDYLRQVGRPLEEVRAVLHDDPTLWELIETPLMLSIMALAYKDISPAKLRTTATPQERRRQLFDDYIAAMFVRRGKATLFSHDQTMEWLGWLAQGMTWQSQSVFLVERLQPQWLSTRIARLQYNLLDRLIGGLICVLLSGLVFGLANGLAFALVFGQVSGPLTYLGSWVVHRLVAELFFGLVYGLIFGLTASFFGGQNDIDNLQRRRITDVVSDTVLGGLVGGLISGLGYGLRGGQRYGLTYGLLGGLLGGLGGGLLGVLTGKPGMHPRKVLVIERLGWSARKAWRSAASGLVFGLVFGLFFGPIYGLSERLDFPSGFRLAEALRRGLDDGLGYGLVFGLFFGLVFGLIGGVGGGLLSSTIRPNQGVRRSVFSALIAGLGGALIVGLCYGLGYRLFSGFFHQVYKLDGAQSYGLIGGLVVVLGGGLSFGGYACLSHLALRLVLARNGSLPLRLVPFLDYCVERIFLRKVGGGYIFVHRLLMEHFASLHKEAGEVTR